MGLLGDIFNAMVSKSQEYKAQQERLQNRSDAELTRDYMTSRDRAVKAGAMLNLQERMDNGTLNRSAVKSEYNRLKNK